MPLTDVLASLYSWLSPLLPLLDTPLVHLLNSVFIEDDAEPQTAMLVMALCIGLVFMLMNIPRSKRQQRLAVSRFSQA